LIEKNYDDETLQQINENVNLLDYVSQFLELEEKGGDYWAHCPKHIDKTPSLSFTPENNSFYCFSCGRSGYIIGYLMKYEDLPFEEAVEKAAKLADFDLSTVCHSDTISFLKRIKLFNSKKRKQFEHPILDEKYYSKYKKEPIDEWLAEGISREMIDLFDIRIDRRANRIVYPVRDANGNLINVKGRTRFENYEELKIPKYINYEKVGVVDYFQSLDITAPYIKQQGEVVIFESIKSVMKAFGWGYKNCVSAEKHTLTDEQVDILVKLGVDIVFAYDNDVDYYGEEKVRQNINKLKSITNVYLIKDKDKLLGEKSKKRAPVDLTQEVWEELYANKKKVV